MSNVTGTRVPRVPDDWTVWAFSDPHGVTSGLVAALQEAGIIDGTLSWAAPPRTALIGCGDYIDRGGDVAGMVAFLRRLEREASAAGGATLLARGNHEAMPVDILNGATEWLDTWLKYGGRATLASFGCDHEGAADPARMARSLETCAPGLLDWLARLPHAVRWRDVVFVHAGLPPHHGLDDLGVSTDEHLWIRASFFETPWTSRGFDAYRAAGIERVVFGHTPQWYGPTLFHAGCSIAIDSNAVGNPRMPADARQELTLVGLQGDVALGDAIIIAIPTAGASDGRIT